MEAAEKEDVGTILQLRKCRIEKGAFLASRSRGRFDPRADDDFLHLAGAERVAGIAAFLLRREADRGGVAQREMFQRPVDRFLKCLSA